MDFLSGVAIIILFCLVILSKVIDYILLITRISFDKNIYTYIKQRLALKGIYLSPFAFHAGATLSLIQYYFILEKEEKNKKEREFNLTIAGMLLGSKARQSIISYFSLVSSALVYILFSITWEHELNSSIILFLSVCLALVHVNQKILEYRVSKGLYGRTEYEAREIINYILSHSDKSDFSDGDKLKIIFPEHVKEENKETALEGALGVVK